MKRVCFPAILALAALLTAPTLAAPSSASAAEAPPELWTAGQNCEVLSGSACVKNKPLGQAGTTKTPRGIATDPVSGHLYVAEGSSSSSRISEFTAWGEFVRAFGFDVAPEGAPGDTPGDQLETCTTTCKAGTSGPAPGQLGLPQGLALDSAGDLYVTEGSCCGGSYRVQKFDLSGPSPAFAWMAGTGVDQGPNHPGDLCTAAYVAEGDTCGAGTDGTNPGQFSNWPALGSFIAIGPADQIYVGDTDRIQEFNIAGEYEGEIAFSGGGAIGELPAPGRVGSLAVDPSTGDLYFAYAFVAGKDGKAVQPDVYRLDSISGEILDTLPADTPAALATNAQGNVFLYAAQLFVNGGSPNNRPPRIFEFDPAGNQIALFAEGELPNVAPPSTGIATGQACYTPGKHGLYASNSDTLNSFIRAYGPPPDRLDGEGNAVCPAPPADPEIEEQPITDADPESTTVAARINPHFWPDTTYYVEWGTGKCSEGGCDKALPLTPAALGGGVVEEGIETAGVVLPELELETTYHFRFVAESTGGGPVYGTDPDGEGPKEASFADGEEEEFTTFSEELPPQTNCPNQAFHTGIAAHLPDCRAYEQVSPLDKSGFDVDPSLAVSRPDGDAVLYSSLAAFAGALASSTPNTYAASRTAAGWQSASLEPRGDPIAEVFSPRIPGISGDFTKRLAFTNSKLTPEAVGGDRTALNIYVHDSADDSYRYVGTAHDEVSPPLGHILEFHTFHGASEDGSDFFFSLRHTLMSAPLPPVDEKGPKLYGVDGETGGLSYLGVLPDGSVDPMGSIGGGVGSVVGRDSAVSLHAVSADGRRVYWKHDQDSPLYLRLNHSEPESARLHGAATGAGDLIGPATATGNLANGQVTVSKVELKSGAFAVGQEISDAGAKIPAGTTIVAIDEANKKLTLSQAATGGKTGAELTGAPSPVVTNLTTETGEFAPEQEISGPGIGPHATVLSVTPGSLTLSTPATETKAAAHLSATSECTEADKACTVLVSERESDGSAQNADLWGASKDGGLAFLTSKDQLTEDASPTGTDLYRYDAEVDQLTDLTPDAIAAGVQKVLGVSEDGAYAYFLATGNLTPGTSGTDPKIYAWHEGATRLVATLASAAGQLSGAKVEDELWRVSPNGHYLGFLFGGRLGAPHPQKPWPHRQAYLYDYDEDTLACASCPPGGYASADVGLHNKVRAALNFASLSSYEAGLTHNVTDAGQFFFQSSDRLLLRDANEAQDVYVFQDDEVHLISSGQGEEDSYFGDADPDGSEAFLFTREGLVGQDTDPLIDLYDARVGGGLASQAASAKGAGCQGDACQGAFTQPPTGAGPGTAAFEGLGNPKAPRLRKCRKGFVKRRGACVKKPRKGQHRANHKRGSRR